jgi:predicted Rossmann fold flavoprotein
MGVPQKLWKDPDILNNFYVKSAKGKQVPLQNLANFSTQSTLLVVNHHAQLPAATISFNLLHGFSLGDAVNKIKAKNYIICTGGKSYPVTGSTGEGFFWAKRLGHSINDLKPALTPIETKDEWTKSLQGVSLENVSVSLVQEGKTVREEKGEILFTHFGLSGPLILNMSRTIGDLIVKGKVKIYIDLLPGKNINDSNKYFQKILEKNRNKHILKSLSDIFPEKLSSFIMNFSGVSLDKKPNQLTKEERERMVRFMKKIELGVVGLLGFDRAMATHGGISLKEIDSKTMKSKIIDNLYFSGEAIDLDGPSGGYNLQMCWTTGYVAGQNAASDVE